MRGPPWSNLVAAVALGALGLGAILWGVRALRRQASDAQDTDDPAIWRQLSAVARDAKRTGKRVPVTRMNDEANTALGKLNER